VIDEIDDSEVYDYDDYDYCDECRCYGDDYRYDPELEEDVCVCDECMLNPLWVHEDD
jgi:hypothetical protein